MNIDINYESVWSLAGGARKRVIKSYEFQSLMWSAVDEIVSNVPTAQELKAFDFDSVVAKGRPRRDSIDSAVLYSKKKKRRLPAYARKSKQTERGLTIRCRDPVTLLKVPLVRRGKYAICIFIQNGARGGQLLELYHQLFQMRAAVKAGREVECHIVLFTIGTCEPVKGIEDQFCRDVPMNHYVERWGAVWNGGVENVGARNKISIVDMSLAPRSIDDCVTSLEKFIYCLMTADLEARQRQWPLIECIKNIRESRESVEVK